MKDLVSIIIPYYKKKLYIRRALHSVYNQTYQKFEIIIVYDDTNLQELYFLKKIINKNYNIKIIVNKKNLGAGYSRNVGVEKSEGSIIAFLDADDFWHKKKIEIQLDFMNKKKSNFSFTSYNIVNIKNRVIRAIPAMKILSYNQLIRSCDIGLSTVMIRKHILKKSKFTNMKTKEDYALWLKIAKDNKLYGINKILTTWQKSSNSLSSGTLQKVKDSYLLYNRQVKYGSLKSIISTIILGIYFIKKRYL
jgi:teichuronic acid biosynthesis glycosyltransferase TuaG